MIIIADGNLIQTDFIYRISEVTKPAGDRRFDDSEGSSDNPDNWLSQFTVHFLNQKSITFVSRSLTSEDHKEFAGRSWDEAHSIKLNRLRDGIVGIWLENQIVIPTFKL